VNSLGSAARPAKSAAKIALFDELSLVIRAFCTPFTAEPHVILITGFAINAILRYFFRALTSICRCFRS
jgi:hypothetical protein